MKHYTLVRIKTNKKSSILLKLNRINVSIKNISYNGDYLVFEIQASDLKRARKYLVSERIEIIDETGFYKLKSEIRKNLLIIVSIIFSTIVFLILSNIIVKVNVIHSKKEIRDLLSTALKERGIEPFTFKKSYDEYERIIASIKEEYKDRIEWLEIDVDGMVINIRIEERIENNISKNYGTCHIVANKSGIITNILTEKGVAEVRKNDYVQKGDVLINGMIKLNDEVKENVCAKGLVYAEVWYNVSASLPLTYQEEKETGKMRYNFMVDINDFKYTILKSRVSENKKVENKEILKIGNMKFYLQKEKELEVTEKKYNEEEAQKEITKIIHEKLSVKGVDISDIMEEKVLKKNVFNGNLDIEMFVAIKEQIGVEEYFEVEMESDTSDRENNENNHNLN